MGQGNDAQSAIVYSGATRERGFEHQHIDKLGEDLTNDPRYALRSKQVNVVLHPIIPDGAALR